MHWRAPTTMLASFTAGIAFAIGHHFFYQSLHHTPVETATFDQQINIGIGTAFAFLVRAFLVIAVGVAFVQTLWQRLLRKDIKIARIDSMTQLLSSLFDLFNFRTIWQHPLLGFLAVISWTLPFAAIIPPATLSVQNSVAPQSQTNPQDLPNVDFDKAASFSKSYQSAQNPLSDAAPGTLPAVWFGGAQDNLNQISMLTALQAEIPQIKPPAQNSSFSLSFVGPAIQCLPTSSDVMKNFDSIFGCNFTISNRSEAKSPCQFTYTYLSWVSDFSDRVPLSVSQDAGSLNFINQYQSSDYGLTTIGAFLNEPTMLYIATFNNSWSVLNCTLYNASYVVKFDFEGGVQSLSTTRELLNSVPFSHQTSSVVAANISGWSPVGTTFPIVSTATVSYYGMMDSFGRIIVGGILYAVSSHGGGNNTLATSIMATGLVESYELGGQDPSITLASKAEQLFENITLELFSSPDFVTTNASRFPTTEVTLFAYPNIYVYTWRRLVLAYGLAVLFATIAVVIGGYVILSSGESYTHNFSTIMRTTRDGYIDTVVRPDDMRGEDPLPKSIAKTSIRVGVARSTKIHEDPNDTELANHAQEGNPTSTTTYGPVGGDEHDSDVSEDEVHGHRPSSDFNYDHEANEPRRSISPLSFELDPRSDQAASHRSLGNAES